MQPTIFVRALCLAATLSCLGAHAQTNVYKWTDKAGRVHFSDTAPPPDAIDATRKRMGGDYVDGETLPYATQVAMKRNPVTLYVGGDCREPCSQARELLYRRGIPYGERDAQANASDAGALKKLVGALEVPTLVVGDTPLKGYEEGQWQAALDGAGYPRARLPGQAARPRQASRIAPQPAQADPPAPETRPR